MARQLNDGESYMINYHGTGKKNLKAENLMAGEIAVLQDDKENTALYTLDKDSELVGFPSEERLISSNMLDEYPKPQRIIKVEFTTSEPIPTQKNEENPILAHGKIKVNIDGLIINKYATIEVQGKSSALKPKKNFTIAFYEDSACTKSYKFRLGGMVAHSEYVYKANYIDCTQARNNACNRLWEQVIYAHDNAPFRGNEGVSQIDTGALCHVDGYPCVVYINDEFYGIGDFNIGKKRDNYDLDKSNQNHMQMQAEPRAQFYSYVESEWEIRNPKTPDEGFATRLAPWFADNAKTGDAFKNDFGNHHNVQNGVDYFVFAEFLYADDILDNNVQLTTWDANEYFMLPYDLDTCFGLKYNGTMIISPTVGSVIDSTLGGAVPAGISTKDFWLKFKTAFFPEISAQYNHLKELGIFSVGNIAKIFSELERPFGSYYALEYEKWPNSPSRTKTSYKQVLDWVRQRLAWMDGVYGVVNPTAITINGADVVENEGVYTVSYEPVGAPTATTWSIVSGSEYATIDNNGKVTSKSTSEQTVIIRATSNAVPTLYAEKTITVKKSEVLPTAITINGDETIIDNGTFTVSYQPADCTETGVTWSITSGSEYATINSNGEVEVLTLTPQMVTIKATSTAVTTVYAEKIITVKSSTVPPTAITVNGNDSITNSGVFTVAFEPEGCTQTNVEWSIVSGGEYATISDTGLVSVKPEVTTVQTIVIRATSTAVPTVYGEKTVSVIASPMPPTAITVSGEDWTIQTNTYTASFEPAYASLLDITWSISAGNDGNYATIDNNGLLTVLPAASANTQITIRATSVSDPTVYGEKDVMIRYYNDYCFVWSAATLDGTTGQVIDSGYKLFSDEMQNWTVFGYIKNNANPSDKYATLYACVDESANPYPGLRCDADNTTTYNTTSASCMYVGINSSTRYYIASSNGTVSTAKPTMTVDEDKYPILVSRSGDTYTYSLNGTDWTTLTGVGAITEKKAKEKNLMVFGERMKTGAIQRALKVDDEVCVALIGISQYGFQSLVEKYSPTATS